MFENPSSIYFRTILQHNPWCVLLMKEWFSNNLSVNMHCWKAHLNKPIWSNMQWFMALFYPHFECKHLPRLGCLAGILRTCCDKNAREKAGKMLGKWWENLRFLSKKRWKKLCRNIYIGKTCGKKLGRCWNKRWKKADARNSWETGKMMEHVEHLGKREEKRSAS